MSIRIPILDQQSSTPFVPINSIQAIQVGDARGRALQGFGGAIGELGDALDRRGKRDELNQAREAASIERGAAISEHAKASADSYSPMDWSLTQNSNLAAVSAVAQHGGYMIGAGGVREGTDYADTPASSPANAALPASLGAVLGGAFPALSGLAGASGVSGAPNADTASSLSPGAAGGDPGPFRFAGLPSDGLTGRVLGSYDTTARQLVSQLPPGSAGPVAEQLSLLRHSVARSSIRQEADLLGKQRQGEFTNAVQGIARSVAAQPDTLGMQLQFIGNHMIDVGPGQEGFRAQMRATVIDAGVKSQISRDPRGMLLALEHRAGAGEDNADSAGGSLPAGPEDHLAEHPVTQAITPAEARQYLGQARAAVATAQSNERAAAAQDSAAALRSYLATGSAAQAPSQAQLIGAFGLEEGQQRYAQLEEARSEGNSYVNLRALPSAALQDMREQETQERGAQGQEAQVQPGQAQDGPPNAVSSGEVVPGAPRSPSQRAIERILRERQADPVQAAFDSASHGLQPIPFTQTALQDGGFAAALRARSLAARQIAGDYQTRPALLSRAEAGAMADALRKMPPPQQQTLLKNLVESSDDGALTQSALQALSVEEPVLALAGWHLDQDDRGGAGEDHASIEFGGSGKIDAPSMTLRGRALLQPADGAAASKPFTMPPLQEMWHAFSQETGDAFAATPGLEKVYFEGARANYAALKFDDGDTGAQLNPDLLHAAAFIARYGNSTAREAGLDEATQADFPAGNPSSDGDQPAGPSNPYLIKTAAPAWSAGVAGRAAGWFSNSSADQQKGGIGGIARPGPVQPTPESVIGAKPLSPIEKRDADNQSQSFSSSLNNLLSALQVGDPNSYSQVDANKRFDSQLEARKGLREVAQTIAKNPERGVAILQGAVEALLARDGTRNQAPRDLAGDDTNAVISKQGLSAREMWKTVNELADLIHTADPTSADHSLRIGLGLQTILSKENRTIAPALLLGLLTTKGTPDADIDKILKASEHVDPEHPAYLWQKLTMQQMAEVIGGLQGGGHNTKPPEIKLPGAGPTIGAATAKARQIVSGVDEWANRNLPVGPGLEPAMAGGVIGGGTAASPRQTQAVPPGGSAMATGESGGGKVPPSQVPASPSNDASKTGTGGKVEATATDVSAHAAVQSTTGELASKQKQADGKTLQGQERSTGGASFDHEEFTAPATGKVIKAAVSGNAAVPLGKVEIFGRGGSGDYKKEKLELNLLKQKDRKKFDADPANAKRLEELRVLVKNHDRSTDLGANFEKIGLPNTPESNRKIIDHLLEVGQKIDSSNRLWFSSELEGPKGTLKIESTWRLLPDGRAYLSTIKMKPIKETQ